MISTTTKTIRPNFVLKKPIRKIPALTTKIAKQNYNVQIGNTATPQESKVQADAAEKPLAGLNMSTERKFQCYPLVWIDVETTGLDPNTCELLEISIVITDQNLEIIDKGLDVVIHQSDKVLNSMDEWCMENHVKNGLVKRVKDSTVTIETAEKQILELIKKYCPIPRRGIFAGNSVHFDRLFIGRHMPNLLQYMHFRIIDVSTINELGKRWAPKTTRNLGRKVGDHRARSDILESIAELKFYKRNLFAKNLE